MHQTLVFLGNVATDSIVALCEQAAQLCLPAFTLEFGVTGYWRHHHIAWAAPVAAPQALRDLVAVLEQGLQEAGFRYDRRSGKTRYAPHVTLIRDARQPDVLPTAEIIWPVRDFVLIESVRGAKGPEYRVLETWRLNQPQTPSESTALKDGAA